MLEVKGWRFVFLLLLLTISLLLLCLPVQAVTTASPPLSDVLEDVYRAGEGAVKKVAMQSFYQGGKVTAEGSHLRKNGVPGYGGNIALLFPFQQEATWLNFGQLRFSYSQGVPSVSGGAGWRWFIAQQQQKKMWGCNLFIDHQIRDKDTRVGAGIEYGQDSFTWRINGYLPFSKWRTFTQRLLGTKVDMHPAAGVDVRLQVIPTAFPQCRAQIIGEVFNWRGIDAVSKKGGITATKKAKTIQLVFGIEVDYTPIPLLTVGYRYQGENSIQSGHNVRLALTYRLGVPLQQQLDRHFSLPIDLPLDLLALVQRQQGFIYNYKRQEFDKGISVQATGVRDAAAVDKSISDLDTTDGTENKRVNTVGGSDVPQDIEDPQGNIEDQLSVEG